MTLSVCQQLLLLNARHHKDFSAAGCRLFQPKENSRGPPSCSRLCCIAGMRASKQMMLPTTISAGLVIATGYISAVYSKPEEVGDANTAFWKCLAAPITVEGSGTLLFIFKQPPDLTLLSWLSRALRGSANCCFPEDSTPEKFLSWCAESLDAAPDAW